MDESLDKIEKCVMISPTKGAGTTETYPKFGDIFYAYLKPDVNIQGGVRPVLIAQNNIGNIHSPVVEVVMSVL